MPRGVDGWGAVMRTIWLVLAGTLLLAAACARPPIETEADQAARSFFAAVARADWAAVDAALAPSAAATAGRLQGFEQARRAIPGGGLQAARVVGWTRTEQDGHKRTSAVHLYRYPGADLAVRTVLERAPPTNAYKVTGFYLSRLPPGVVEANRFTLAGKDLRHMLFLAALVVSPLVMLGVAALAAFTPGLRWRLVWMALCFVGVGAAWLNWTTGEGGFVATQIGLIAVGASRATDISPWVLKFSAPVGALAVLVRLMLHRPRAPAS